MKHNPDDRSDNVERIQENINNTYQKMEAADELIAMTEDPKTRKQLKQKNSRRNDALDSMRSEIKDEAEDRQDQ